MSQRREHRLRSLEKQYGAIAEQVASQDRIIYDMQSELLRLQRKVFETQLSQARVPWYKRLFGRERR